MNDNFVLGNTMTSGAEVFTWQVRDQLTSSHEQACIGRGSLPKGSLKPDALGVDAIVSTIGFPLVGEAMLNHASLPPYRNMPHLETPSHF